MAEALFNARHSEHAGWSAQSAGVFAAQGAPATPEVAEVLSEWGVELSKHQSAPLSQELVDAASWIVVMTAFHAEEVERRFPDAAKKVRLLASFASSDVPENIPDPIGQSVGVYRQVRDWLDFALTDLGGVLAR